MRSHGPSKFARHRMLSPLLQVRVVANAPAEVDAAQSEAPPLGAGVFTRGRVSTNLGRRRKTRGTRYQVPSRRTESYDGNNDCDGASSLPVLRPASRLQAKSDDRKKLSAVHDRRRRGG